MGPATCFWPADQAKWVGRHAATVALWRLSSQTRARFTLPAYGKQSPAEGAQQRVGALSHTDPEYGSYHHAERVWRQTLRPSRLRTRTAQRAPWLQPEALSGGPRLGCVQPPDSDPTETEAWIRRPVHGKLLCSNRKRIQVVC